MYIEKKIGISRLSRNKGMLYMCSKYASIGLRVPRFNRHEFVTIVPLCIYVTHLGPLCSKFTINNLFYSVYTKAVLRWKKSSVISPIQCDSFLNFAATWLRQQAFEREDF